MQIEVRCCCQPQKLLGWLPVPDGVGAGDTVHFVVSRPRWRLASREAEPVFEMADVITLPVAILDENGRSSLALKSEETPVERLRQIPGFVEARA